MKPLSGRASSAPRRAAVDTQDGPGHPRALAVPRHSAVTPRGLVAGAVAATVIALGLGIAQVPGASAGVASASPAPTALDLAAGGDLMALTGTATPTVLDAALAQPAADLASPSPAPEQSEAPAPQPTARATESPAAPSVAAETLVVTTALNLRSAPEASSSLVVVLSTGTSVSASASQGDWRQVTAATRTGWVKAAYLTTPSAYAARAKPSTSATGPTTPTAAGVAGSYPACPRGSSIEATLTARATVVHRAVCATFPNVSSFQNSGTGEEHSTGRAIDIMVTGAPGREIAAWLRANSSSLGVISIIYEQKIWTSQRASEGWRAMSDRGSATANHRDHVHVLVS